MSFKMLACDYDRTLADEGVILPDTEQALIEAKEAGFMLGMVTGREFEDLLNVCPQIELFEMVVAENGAVLYMPASKYIKDLVPPPPPRFTEELSRRKVPFSAGRVIVGTVRPHDREMFSVISDLELDLEVIFNKQDVMVLPSGVNKATGLEAGLEKMGIPASEIIAVGDAENDLVFLRAAGYAVAVANALDSVKAEADYVTTLPRGEGVAEFIREHLLKTVGRNGER